MAKRILKNGKPVAYEIGRLELVKIFEQKFGLRLTDEQLDNWEPLIPMDRVEGGVAVYRYDADLKLLRLHAKRAWILRTNMTIERVRDIENEGLLDMYSSLSEDAPEGVTADVWRSYFTVVLFQTRYGLMLTAEELAIRARLQTEDPFTGDVVPDIEESRKHLRILQSIGVLRHGGNRWEHAGPPKCVR